jgi:hydroxypyruvate isomerase
MKRRDVITRMGGAMALGAAGLDVDAMRRAVREAGRLKQSVCRWCYEGIPLDTLCQAAKEIGLRSIELLDEHEWEVPKRYGLTCAVANGPCTIALGFNRPSEHDRFVKESERLLPLVAKAGFPNMIVFSGNRAGMSDGEGLENCVAGLKRITPIAERAGVTVVMELLNSKVDHKDYMCDRTPWGAELVRRVASPRFKLLYDIYHMQIMEGDVIRTIRDNWDAIGHYHTGGVPGRNEIDDTQELAYPPIMRAIADRGYTGFIGQEFIPKRDPLASLAQGVKICDV